MHMCVVWYGVVWYDMGCSRWVDNFLLCCAVLCCAVLCCAALCCAVLCCTVLYCTVLCCAVLFCIISYSISSCLVSHFTPSLKNEEAEELMRRIEKEEERLSFTEPDKQCFHLCIVNLGQSVLSSQHPVLLPPLPLSSTSILFFSFHLPFFKVFLSPSIFIRYQQHHYSVFHSCLCLSSSLILPTLCFIPYTRTYLVTYELTHSLTPSYLPPFLFSLPAFSPHSNFTLPCDSDRHTVLREGEL